MEEIREYDISKCPKIPLTDLVEYIVDNRGKTVPTTNEGIKLIATNCIRNEYLYPLYEKVRYVSQQIYDTWFRAHPKPGDIIFVNKGGPGKTALVPDNLDFCIAQDMMAFHVKSDVIYNKYLLAVLRSRPIQQFILNSQVGTIIPHFKKEQLKSLLIPLPDMTIQKRIGDFYFNISEKCENNRKINENLEQQAQALFKSWFIDFEPFKDGKFIDSELGPIPQGWRVGTLDEICCFISRGISPKYDETTEEFVLGQTCVRNNIVTLNNARKHRPKVKNEKWTRQWDVLINSTGVGSLGRVGIVYFDKANVAFDSHLTVVRTKDDITKLYVGRNLLNRQLEIENMAVGSTGQTELPRDSVKSMPIIIPTHFVFKKFNELIKPMALQMYHLINENISLSKTRDTVLPKLMSGEIKV